MDLLQSLGMMAGYNRWMNEKLYAFCALLPDEERKRDRKAFFRSIHGTLNHLLLTDRGWLWRFNGKPWTFRSLDQELYNDFEELCRERVRTDHEIEDFVAALSPERLAHDFTYQTYAGTTFTHPLAPALVHLFNHQTPPGTADDASQSARHRSRRYRRDGLLPSTSDRLRLTFNGFGTFDVAAGLLTHTLINLPRSSHSAVMERRWTIASLFAYSIWATSFGFSQRHSAILSAVRP
jgi:uncharacterized damage-inducible protein DinB